MNSQFYCQITQLSWKKFIKFSQDQIEIDKSFDERNKSLLTQFKASNSYFLLPYGQLAVLSRQF